MKAISLRQPWAWLVVEGYKPIEFRYRSDKFRGECYIQASRKWDASGYTWLENHPKLPGVREMLTKQWAGYNFGYVIGKVTVVDCMKVEQARLFYPDDMYLTVCQATLGDKAFILQNPIHFAVEDYFECKGKVAPLFFDVPDLSVNLNV